MYLENVDQMRLKKLLQPFVQFVTDKLCPTSWLPGFCFSRHLAAGTASSLVIDIGAVVVDMSEKKMQCNYICSCHIKQINRQNNSRVQVYVSLL